jgi:hypothetical protein
MGWAVGYDRWWCRDIGYGVPATCDYPGCAEQIDRGLGYACCDGEGEGCGLFFCGEHGALAECDHVFKDDPDYRPSQDVSEWLLHKLVDESWQQWRAENPEMVAVYRRILVERGDMRVLRMRTAWNKLTRWLFAPSFRWFAAWLYSGWAVALIIHAWLWTISILAYFGLTVLCVVASAALGCTIWQWRRS